MSNISKLKRFGQIKAIFQILRGLSRVQVYRSKAYGFCNQLQRSLSTKSRPSFSHVLKNNHGSCVLGWGCLEPEIRDLDLLLLSDSSCQLSCASGSSKKHFSTSSQRNNEPKQGSDNNNDGGNDSDDDKGEEDRIQVPLVPTLLLISTVLGVLYTMINNSSGKDPSSVYRYISWNEFVHEMLAKGEVAEIIVRPEVETALVRLHEGAIIKGNKAQHILYTIKLADVNRFEEKLRQAETELGVKPGRGIPVSYQRDSQWAAVVLMVVVVAALFTLLSKSKISFGNPMDSFDIRKAKFLRADKLKTTEEAITFKDVAGLHEAKIEVMEFVDYLKSSAKFKALGGRIPRGALLVGPPGCGKTLLAKAVANEAQVPFLAMDGSAFVEMIGGLGAARVRDLFEEARKNAPCIIYIDEIDAIGRNRSGQSWEGIGEEEHTLNQLLVDMDGMGTTDGVIVLAATNRPDVLDKALLRPGRFDRHITIDYPTLLERKETFEMYLKKVRLTKCPTAFSDHLAHLSPGMSGADISNIINEAALHAAREKRSAIGREDFDYAIERVIAGAAKKSGILSPEEKKIVAYHECGHALTGWLLKHTDALLKISIVPRTSRALGFALYMPADRKHFSQEEIFERMCMALGGRVAESLKFNRITTGAQDDLNKVTQMAYDQIRSYGMNATIGQVAFEMGDVAGFATKPYSKKLAYIIDQEAKMLVARAYKTTETLLLNNMDKLETLAANLLEKEELNYDTVASLIGEPPYGPKKALTPTEWQDS